MNPTYKIRIKGTITDDTFDDFCRLLKVHDADFFGSYNETEMAGDLYFGKYGYDIVKPYLLNFSNRRKFDMIVSIHS